MTTSNAIRLLLSTFLVFAVAGFSGGHVSAAFLLTPDDAELRFDVELLRDSGVLAVPLLSWPLSTADIAAGIATVELDNLDEGQLLAVSRIRKKVMAASDGEYDVRIRAASNPREVRMFDDTPRDEAEVRIGRSYARNRFAGSLKVGYTVDPGDGDTLRPDGTWGGVRLGNWLFTAGWQARWWGPGQNSSLILSTNARPLPALALQRNISKAVEHRWLHWLGPWTFNAFMGRLDDDRTVNNALLAGMRFSFRPHADLEVGLSRSAQWCGEGRPCGGREFWNLLLGRDNRGVNVDSTREPGNQLAGADVRWQLPTAAPLAIYLQFIGEDTRRGGPELGSWLRMAGLETWGGNTAWRHRGFIEIAETSCRRGGLGFSGNNPDCGYEHGIYRSGYRYEGRSLGHAVDGDGFSYSAGLTLVQSAGHRWSVALRFSEINRIGNLSTTHSLSALPMEQADIMIGHSRSAARGKFLFGLGLRQRRFSSGRPDDLDLQAYIEWRSI